MSWNANNSPSNSGYTLETYKKYPDIEQATATVTNVATTAPNLSQTATGEYIQTQLEVAGAQQGTNAISNVTTITASWAGLRPNQLQLNNYTAGAVGTIGNKFS